MLMSSRFLMYQELCLQQWFPLFKRNQFELIWATCFLNGYTKLLHTKTPGTPWTSHKICIKAVMCEISYIGMIFPRLTPVISEPVQSHQINQGDDAVNGLVNLQLFFTILEKNMPHMQNLSHSVLKTNHQLQGRFVIHCVFVAYGWCSTKWLELQHKMFTLLDWSQADLELRQQVSHFPVN